MASAPNALHPAAAQIELRGKYIEKQLVQMEQNIMDSLRRGLQPIRKSLQDLHLCQQQDESLAAQRDAMLLEPMKMYAPSCDVKTQAVEPLQALEPRSVMPGVTTAKPQNPRGVLPSIEEVRCGRDGLHSNSLVHISPPSKSGDGAEKYEPPNELIVHAKGATDSDLKTECRRNLVDRCVAADASQLGQLESHDESWKTNTRLNVPLAKRKPYDEPVSESISGDGPDTPKPKRQRPG